MPRSEAGCWAWFSLISKRGCEHIVLVMNLPSVVLLWRKNNDLNPVFYKNCKRLFSFTGIYRGHGREKLEYHVFFDVQLSCTQVKA